MYIEITQRFNSQKDLLEISLYGLGSVAARAESGEWKQTQQVLDIVNSAMDKCEHHAVYCLSKIIYKHGSAMVGVVLPSIVRDFLMRIPLKKGSLD